MLELWALFLVGGGFSFGWFGFYVFVVVFLLLFFPVLFLLISIMKP